jgi:hypothetical protein
MLRSALAVVFVVLLLLVTLGQKPAVVSHENLDNHLRSLTARGVSYRYLDESTIELSDTTLGWKSTKTLRQPDEATIRNWAASRNIPVIDIDPTLVDTSKWVGWFDFWTYVPVGNSVRIPTQVSDFDGNGEPEIYGSFGGVGFPQTRAYEVHHDGSCSYVFDYGFGSISTHIVDVDHNGLREIVFQRSIWRYFFEPSQVHSFPTDLKFAYAGYDGLAPSLSREFFVEMNNDSLLEFVHRGADTTISPYNLTCVSQYNPADTNFNRVWCMAEDGLGYDVGDYDGDSRREYVSSGLWGALYVVENQGGNAYEVTFRDTLPLVNMFYQSSGDIDHDGRREFFVAATMSSGNWTVMYETDGDNHFTPRIALHLLSGGTLDDPTYIAEDVDGDGIVELAILSGGYLYIFKSDRDNSYYLWYMKQGPASFTFNFHDMNGDGIQDILWTRIRNSSWVSDIFVGSPLMSVEPSPEVLPAGPKLMQNYPNPFNPTTNIRYGLPRSGFVTLTVFNSIGQQVAQLVNGERQAGYHHVIFHGDGLASGVYFYRLEAGSFVSTKKLLLLK